MIETEFLDQMDRFRLIMKKRVNSRYVGQRKSALTGRGTLFKDYRQYSEGDDFRTIDWKVFARTDSLLVKQFEEERNLSVHIIVDNSASMAFKSDKFSKFDYASMLGLGFAYLAIKENEKFQFATFSDDLNLFQSKRGMSHLAIMKDHLEGMEPKGESKIFEALSKYRKMIHSKSMIVIISDFLYDVEEIEEGLAKLGKQEVHIIQVFDPVEKKLQLNGDFNLEDAETHERMRTYVSPRLRDEYANRLENHCSLLKKACIRMGAKYFQATTDEPVFDVFFKALY